MPKGIERQKGTVKYMPQTEVNERATQWVGGKPPKLSAEEMRARVELPAMKTSLRLAENAAIRAFRVR